MAVHKLCQVMATVLTVLSMKCPPNIPGQWNMTPLQIALIENHSDVAKYLQD